MRYLIVLSVAVLVACSGNEGNPTSPFVPLPPNDSLLVLTPPANTGALDGLYVASWLGLHDITISPYGCSMAGIMRVTDLRVNGTRVWFKMRDPFGWGDPVEAFFFNGEIQGDQIVGNSIWLSGYGTYQRMIPTTFVRQ